MGGGEASPGASRAARTCGEARQFQSGALWGRRRTEVNLRRDVVRGAFAAVVDTAAQQYSVTVRRMCRFVAAGIVSFGGCSPVPGWSLESFSGSACSFQTWLTWYANILSARAFRVRSTTEQSIL